MLQWGLLQEWQMEGYLQLSISRVRMMVYVPFRSEEVFVQRRLIYDIHKNIRQVCSLVATCCKVFVLFLVVLL